VGSNDGREGTDILFEVREGTDILFEVREGTDILFEVREGTDILFEVRVELSIAFGIISSSLLTPCSGGHADTSRGPNEFALSQDSVSLGAKVSVDELLAAGTGGVGSDLD
jgi:hypothetical protein